MTANIFITVEDVADKLATGYTRIELHSASSVSGAYSLVTSVNLISGDYSYPIVDPSGTLNIWYKYRFTGAGGAAPISDFSNPFQPEGATRLKIRQRAIVTYRCGVPLLFSSGDSNTLVTTDPRYANPNFSTGRGKGGWVRVTTGSRRGEESNILPTSVPSSGTIEISPALTGAPVALDEFEWHWVTSPAEWDEAINRGLKRYSYVERVPIVGLGTQEISLGSIVPWLRTKRDVIGIWWYPNGAQLEEPFGTQGRWWTIRQDADALILITNPTITTAETIYLEAWRPTPEVFTDDSLLPFTTDIDLAAALAYDEVMANLLRPGEAGASIDKAKWVAERAQHQRRLRSLASTRMPRPRYQIPQFAEPANVPVAWSAR